MQIKRLLMISTDRKIFEQDSTVRARQIEYAKEWDEVHIIVFSKKNSNIKETVISKNCWAYSTQSWSKFVYPFDAMRFGRFIIEKRGITEITCQDASLTAMAGISLKKQFNIPLEIQVHEDIGSPYFTYNISNKIRKSLALSHLLKADRIRVVSNRIRDYLIEKIGIDKNNIIVKPIAIDEEKIRNASIIGGADLHKKYIQFEKIVLMASRLEKEKNIDLAIEAFAKVVEKIPKAGLVIMGSGSQKDKLENLVKKSGLEKSVVFEGWQDNPFSYYKTCDCFLVTSRFEGYGLTLAEVKVANDKGVGIIVSTDVGIAKEIGVKVVGQDITEISEDIIKNIS